MTAPAASRLPALSRFLAWKFDLPELIAARRDAVWLGARRVAIFYVAHRGYRCAETARRGDFETFFFSDTRDRLLYILMHGERLVET